MELLAQWTFIQQLPIELFVVKKMIGQSLWHILLYTCKSPGCYLCKKKTIIIGLYVVFLTLWPLPGGKLGTEICEFYQTLKFFMGGESDL